MISGITIEVAEAALGIEKLLLSSKSPLALKSVALIGIIGIFSALLITFVIQPLVFHFFVYFQTKKGNPPFEIKRFIHSLLSFMYYGLGGLILSFIGAFLVKILPFSRKKKLQGFHYLMSKFMHSVFLTYPLIKRKIINNQNENFQKPAVIIANHTSFLDILAVGMLSPKIIFLVSDWVYNSPFFGKGVRLAGFYPVSNGIDNGIEHLRDKVNQGFSLMVFPEGTRSVDNSVKRFHKGAFYLAEQFNLDIIPIVIHGYSEASPKGDFMLYKASTTVEILDRIAPNNVSFGENYTEKSKKINTFFKEHYKKMRLKYEDANYFKSTLLNSYDYKEIQIVQSVKSDLNANLESYHRLNKYISPKAKVLHIAKDYGQLDMLLTLQESHRKIITFIEEEQKTAVAKTNYILKKRVILYLDDFNEIVANKYDVVLISNGNFEIEKIIKVSDRIILINNSNLKIKFIDIGFEIEAEENQLIVLKKRIQ